MPRSFRLIRLFSILAAWVPTQAVFAYPEMIRHGYVNCTACHVSPSGGGTLTEYGRSLSGEVFSTWSQPGESGYLYGLLPTTQTFQGGGDFRFIQTHRETSTLIKGETIFMQLDAELAVQLGKWTALVSGGIEESESEGNDESLGLISRKHWVGYRFQDNFFLRAGRFQRNFLFNTAEHETLVKRLAAFYPASETYNVEASYLGEDGEFFLTANLGRPDRNSLDRESGTTIKGALNLSTNSKLGLQYDYSRNTKMTRHLFGPYLAYSFNEKIILLSEFVFNRGALTGKEPDTGLTTYQRLSYEVFKGGWLYGIHEWKKQNFSTSSSINGLTAGFQFFPRPHFEFNLMYQHLWMPAPAGQSDFIGLLGHYYL